MLLVSYQTIYYQLQELAPLPLVLMFRPFISLKYEEGVQLYSFMYGNSVVLAIFVEETVIFSLMIWHLCQPVGSRCLNLFLKSQFCFIDAYISPRASTATR